MTYMDRKPPPAKNGPNEPIGRFLFRIPIFERLIANKVLEFKEHNHDGEYVTNSQFNE